MKAIGCLFSLILCAPEWRIENALFPDASSIYSKEINAFSSTKFYLDIIIVVARGTIAAFFPPDMVHNHQEFPPAGFQKLLKNKSSGGFQSGDHQNSGSTSKTFHLILCEQIVKEVIISEREIRDGVGITSSSNNNSTVAVSSTSSSSGPYPFSQPRSTSTGTLPHYLASTSSSTEPSLPPTPPLTATLLTPEYIKRFQNKKLTKHLAWKDERKAVSLLFCWKK